MRKRAHTCRLLTILTRHSLLAAAAADDERAGPPFTGRVRLELTREIHEVSSVVRRTEAQVGADLFDRLALERLSPLVQLGPTLLARVRRAAEVAQLLDLWLNLFHVLLDLLAEELARLAGHAREEELRVALAGLRGRGQDVG
jgi:hypothetical protein